MSNNSIEFQVQLGLQGALQLVQLLHKALEDSVKVDSGAFKSITSMLQQALNAADKLAGKVNNAFKTSGGSRTFLREYERMIELISAALLKMGNLGFEDIKFSVKDLETIDAAVKKMLELEKTLSNILSGKAIDIINNSSVDGIENLRTLILNLGKDVSKMSFELLTTEFVNKMHVTNKELEATLEKVKAINESINNINTSGLTNIKDALENSEGVGRKLTDFGEIDKINEKLSNYVRSLELASTSIKTFHANDNIDKFIKELTELLLNALTDLIKTVSENKKILLSLITDIDNAGRISPTTGRKLFNKAEAAEIIDSQAMQLAIKNFNILLEEGFSSLRPELQVARLKLKLLAALADLGKQEESWTTARADIEKGINSIFDGSGELVIINVNKFKKSLKDALSATGIDLKDLNFNLDGITVNSSVTLVIESLKAAIGEYVEALKKAEGELSNTKIPELALIYKAFEDAIRSCMQALDDSANILKNVQSELDGTKLKIIDLVNEYNKLSDEKITIVPKKLLYEAKSAIEKHIDSIMKLENKLKALSNVLMAVTRWMGFYQVLNLTKRAINDMKQHVLELDTVMTKIAVVTNMTQNDLWNQIGTYSEIARQYGVAIKGVYEVSLIYYQQGLNKGDVMTLTTETLKMARIAGIDYATAADYMTTAIRGFKLEMSEAAHVTDVFSNLAAHTASSTEELAVAISKTAASAASVGASFESTSAMMATMIATTRESATNIGTALKSIIARYGELKENITGTDAEGEEYSLNKVDKALLSVGISIHNAAGQFRDFDDVILELGEAWDTIDKNTQRYIATVMAGNRQQSRFLALVSNVEEYKKALELANNSEDTGELLTLKTLDSVDAKIEKMKVTIQEFYTSSGILNLYKGILDTITNVISAANDLPKVFGNLPVTAIAVGLLIVSAIKNLLTLIIAQILTNLELIKLSSKNAFTVMTNDAGQAGTTAGQRFKTNFEALMQALAGSGKNLLTKVLSTDAGKHIAMIASTALSTGAAALSLSATNAYGASRSGLQDLAAAGSMFGSAALNGLSGFISGTLVSGGNPLIGAVSGVVSLLPSLISAISMHTVTLARDILLKTKAANEALQEATKAKGTTKELETARDKLASLKEASTSSADALKEYKDYMNQLADTYPELISRIELTGDKTIELASLEEKLADSRSITIEKTIESLKKLQELNEALLKSFTNLTTATTSSLWSGLNPNMTEQLLKDFILQNAPNSGSSPDTVRIAAEKDAYLALLNWYNKNLAPSQLLHYDSWNKLTNYESVMGNFDLINSRLFSNSIKANLKTALTHFLEESTTAGTNISIADITQGQLTSLEDLDNITQFDKLLELLNKILERASEYSNTLVQSFASINDLLSRYLLQFNIENVIGTKKIGLKPLANYTDFITSMIENEFGLLNWTSEEYKELSELRAKNWQTWLNLYSDDADQLMATLNFDNIRNVKLLGDILSSHHISRDETELYNGEAIYTAYEALYEEYVKTIRDNYQSAIRDALGIGTNYNFKKAVYNKGHGTLYSVFNGEMDAQELSPEIANQLIDSLSEYRKLTKNGYVIAAEDYLNNLEVFYGSIASIDDLTEISSIIKDLDLTDMESIDQVISSLENYGDTYSTVIEKLNNIKRGLYTNVILEASLLREAVPEVVKAAEKSFNSLNKGMQLSEALEAAQKIYEGLSLLDQATINLSDLYKFDEVLQEWVLTDTAFKKLFELIENDMNNKALAVETNINLMQDFISLIKEGSDDINVNAFENGLSKFLEKYNITDENEIMYWKKLAEDYSIDFYENFTGGGLDEYFENLEQELASAKQNDIAAAKNIVKNSALAFIASVDYKAIAGGTYSTNTRATLETILKYAGVNESLLGTAFDDIWANLLKGDYEEFNKLLTNAQINFLVSDEVSIESAKAEFELYQAGLNEIFNMPVLSWSKATKEIAGITNETDLSTIDIDTIASDFLSNIQRLVSLGVVSIEEYNNIIASYIKWGQELQGIGKLKKLFDALSNGFTREELISLGALDEKGLKAELSDLLELNPVTGEYKIKAKDTVVETIVALATALNIALDQESEEFKNAVSAGVDESNAKIDKNNSDLLAKKIFETLNSATVGSHINASQSKLALYILRRAGFNVDADGNITIVSEKDLAKIAELDRILEQDISEQTKAANPEVVKFIKEMVRNYHSNRNRYSALSGIISKTTTTDAAKKMQEAFGDTGDTDTFMQNLGFYYENELGIYIAAAESIEKIQEKINELNNTIENETNQATKNELNELIIALLNALNLLELQFNNPEASKTLALNNLLSNYTDISDEVYSQFKAEFNFLESDLTGIFEITNGKRKANINKLKEKLENDYSNYFDDIINTIADEYISNAEKAGSLFTQGTTSQVEMSGFKEAYKKLTGAEVEFIFDPLLLAWTIDVNNLKTYLSAVAATMNLDTEQLKAWVENLLKTLITDNLDFSNILSGTATVKELQTLIKLLENYVRAHATNEFKIWPEEKLKEFIESYILGVFNNLLAGGQHAIEQLKSIKGELSLSDIEAAYRAQIAPIKALYDLIDELQVGSVVATNLIETLRKAGFEVNADGVVTAVRDLVTAYLSLYNLMKETGEATTAELNSALGKYLDSKDGQLQAIDALSNATNMTYSLLADIYTQANKELTMEMVNSLEESGIISSIGGNKIRIQDFTAFANEMGWKAGTEEYVSAFKAYKDSLIQIDNDIRTRIFEEVKAISDASAGDTINLTYLTTILNKEILNKLTSVIEQYGGAISDGTLLLSDNANIILIFSAIIDNLEQNLGDIPGLDALEIARLKDARTTLLNNIISSISSGAGGTLSSEGFATLAKYAKDSFGMDLEATRTSEGLKLTTEGLFSLYARIRQVDLLSAKKLLPDLKKISQNYSTLPDTLRDYRKALELTSENEAVGIADIILEYLSEPETYAFDKSFANTQDEIAKNAYSGAFNTYKNWAQAGRQGYIAADLFTSTLAQLAKYKPDLIIGTTGKTALLLYDERFGYMTIDRSGNPIYDLKSMGLTGENITALMDTFEEYTNFVVQKSNIQQRAYMDLIYAQRELQKAEDVNAEHGMLTVDRIRELASAGSAVETAFKNIHFEDGTLYDKIFGSNAEDSRALADQFIKILADTDLSLEDMQQQVSAMFGDDFVVTLNDEGLFKIELAEPKFVVGNKTLKGDAVLEWHNAVTLALEENIDRDEGTITYTIDGLQVVLQILEDGSVEYTMAIENGPVINASTEADLRKALSAWLATLGIEETETVEGANLTTVIKVDGVKYIIEYDANGEVIVKNENGVSFDNALSEQLAKKYKLSDTKTVPVDGNVNIEADNLHITLPEGQKATVDNETLQTDEVTLSPLAIKIEGSEENTVNPNSILDQLKEKLSAPEAKPVRIDHKEADAAIDAINARLAEPITKTVYVLEVNMGAGSATGNVALAKGRKTLMGELGPELYVSNGHYYVAGLGGAEMVDLPADAIVFNHILTRSLLKNGKATRGKAVVNERIATGMAHAAGATNKELAVPSTILGAGINKGIKLIEKADEAIETGIDAKKEEIEVVDEAKKAEERKALALAAVEKALLDGMKRSKQLMESTNETGKKIEDLSHELKANANLSREEYKEKEKELNNLLNSDAGFLYQLNGGFYSEERINAIEKLIQEAEGIAKKQEKIIDQQSNLITELKEEKKEEKKEENNDKKNVVIDPNRLHTGYKRVNNDNKETTTSADLGRYRFRTVGPSDTSLGGYDSARIKAMALGYGSVGSDEAAKKMSELLKAVATTINNLLTLGFESIDLASSDYEKLDAKMKTEMLEYIKRADASYREFVKMYGEAANLTVSEFNTKYFEAWQKDIGNTGESSEIREAARNLSFFGGGSIAGSAEDWITLFGEYTAVVDLVNAGIIDWNEDLEQYVVTSIEALQQFDTNLDITKFQDIIADSLRATSKAMTDLISKAESGEITYEEFNKLNAYLDLNQLSLISRDVLTLTANGLVVNYKTLANLYAEAVNKNLDKETLNTLRNIKDTRLTNINNALLSGMGGSMKWEELDNLQSLLDDYDDKTAIKFTLTTEGLKLSTDTLIHFYNLLLQVDGILAHLTFKRLNDSLKESNTHYKSATTILARIKDLQDAINDAEHYSDEKIRQYQEELSLAEEILAVRATSKDDSFDFINQELPGGLNNPLTYANAWAEGWKEIKLATGEDGSGIIDFKMFYNMANEINNLAKTTGASLNFFGTTLDGGIENLDKLITKAASSLGSSVDGSKFGVSLAKFGGDLTSGMDSYADSADEAMHTMAQALIKVLDGLIAMFEMIVAMEEFEGADLDMDGILDLDEVFDLTGLTEDMYDTATKFKAEFVEGAKGFLEVLNSNEEYGAMADAVKLLGYTIRELIEDAADGIREIDISASMYQLAVSVLFEALKNGDFNPDDIYNSLKEFLLSNESGYNGTFLLNDIIIDLKYGAEVKVTEAGYEAAGKTYDNENDAFLAAILARQGAKNIEVVEGQATGTLTVGKLDMTVTSVDKNVTYNGLYSTLDDAIKALYEAAKANGETTLKLEEWKIKLEITVVPVVNANLKESSLELDLDQINAAIGKSYEDIKAEWEAALGSEESTLEFEATYGIQLNENTTEEDWARFKELAGIETKNVELNVAINVVNSDNILEQLLSTNGGNVGVDANPEQAEKKAEQLLSDINSMTSSITIEAVDNASSTISSIQDSLNDLERTYTATIETEDKTDTSTGGESSAKGTVSGTAMAGGTQTLMGELGPELYVSNGRYHLAGLNGAEFVNLPDDAIVFNHLLTQRLLATGSAGRGKPITNERNAVAMARGTEGPAAASAREILATLKQMRAMWESLANMSVRELAGVGETKSGGDKKQVAAWLAQVERWYNLLLKIARLEKEINYQEALRNLLESARVPDGETYYKSLVQSLDNLKLLALTYKELADSQEAYFKLRQTELNSEESPFSKYYTYDDFGLIKFNTNANGESMFNELEAIVHLTDYGETLTPAEQYLKYVQEMGLDLFALRKADGTLINRGDYEDQDEFFRDSVQAVWERMEAEQKEMQDLYNSKEDNKVKYLNLITEANKILQEIVDNLMEVENNVLKALETRELKVIDKMSDERLALADSSAEYIKGLLDALSQERTMYERLLDQNDLTKLQRQLAILLRSGGSASEIANLLQLISEQLKDAYFSAQEQAISSALDASDLQLEKLLQLIDIMQETLEYLKENGLLWREAIAIMNKTPNEIVEFITANMDDWKSKSVTGLQEEIRKLTSMTQQWVGYRLNLDSDLFDTQLAINEGFEALVEAAYDPAAIDLSDVIGADINNWRKTPVTYKEDHANTSNVPNANNYAYGYNNLYSNDLMLAYMHGLLDYENLTPEMRRLLENNIRSYGQDFIPTAGIAGSLAAAYNTLSSVMSRTLGTNIDNMSLNMYVSLMSNDYDAELAGRKVMNTILDAASKSAGSNRVRR